MTDEGNTHSEASYDFRAEVFALVEAFGPDAGAESMADILRDIADELQPKEETSQ